MKLWISRKYIAATVLMFTLLDYSNADNLNTRVTTAKARDYAEKVYEYRKAAEEGDVESQLNLGAIYAFGHYGEPKDHIKSAHWYRKAAEQGNANAQFSLASQYARGLGVPLDYTEAARWSRKAAEQGLPQAQHAIGNMFDRGLGGVQQDFAKAVYWYRKAAEQGMPLAQYSIGSMFEEGLGIQRDFAKAVHWYHKAAEQGEAKAQYELGYSYSEGQGVPKNLIEGRRWYLKAAVQGNAGAVRWFQKLAEQGDASMQQVLGFLYNRGLGVPQNSAKAMHWYRKSIEQGNTANLRTLRKLAQQGDTQANQVLLSLISSKPQQPAQATDTGDVIKRYMEALRAENYEAAASQLVYPTYITHAEKKQQLTSLVIKIKETNAMLGSISGTGSTDMPAGVSQNFNVSMIPLKDHPSMSGMITIPIVFSKAGDGVLAFLMGKIDGQKGLYEVQYWCFTCTKEKIYVKTNTKGLYSLVLSRSGKDFQILSSKFNITLPELSDDGQYVAYISKENGKADLFIQKIRSGRRVRAIDSVVNPVKVSFSLDSMELIIKTSGGRIEKYNYSNDF